MAERGAANGLIVAVDQGTSSVKVAAFDLTGHLVRQVTLPTEVHLRGSDVMEASPERWWEQCTRALRRLLSELPVPPAAIRAVGLCGVMHTLVPVDSRGCALGAVPLWADQRYRHESAASYREVWDAIAEPSASSCVGRLAWMFESEPQLRPASHHLLPLKDFLRLKLTGVAATDYYEAEGTGLMAATGRRWEPELLQRLGISASLLPEIVRPDELVGKVTAAAAEFTGLPAGTAVVAGTGDWYAVLVGSNAVLPDQASLYLGTAGVLGGFRSREALRSLGEAPCFGAVTSTGSAIDWLARLILPDAPDLPDGGAEMIAALAERSEPGAHGVTFLPHLMGERGDEIRPDATAAFAGLRLSHNRCDLARAAVEGTAVWLRAVTLSAVAAAGVEALLLSGGGAKSRLNATIAAALYDLPVVVPEVVETGALGVALLAARGVGATDDLAATAAEWVKMARREEPSPSLVERYREIVDAFAQVEAALQSVEEHSAVVPAAAR